MPHHVVVDGSNLATEGRTAPSLKQLNEAVLAYMDEDPTALITVVVDATFGHRIDAKEVAEFDDAVSNNELVAPPAGAIGRGDAFVLSIANKVNADILTNDSYQEFHAQYDWLFDEGRLIGGKPVPHIGWVFVKRLPVRGPLSRKVTSEAKRKSSGSGAGSARGRGRSTADDATVRVGSPDANMPMPVPKSPPPRAAAKTEVADVVAVESPAKPGRGRGGRTRNSTAGDRAPQPTTPVATAASTGGGSTVNDLLSFLTFIERHPAGTSVNAIVDHYSSHGAYVRIGDMVGYVPLRLMADPAPRSAREFMKVGESVTLIVESFVPTKRSVDLAVPGMGSAKPLGEAAPARAAKATKRAPKPVAPKATAVEIKSVEVKPAEVKPVAAKATRAVAKKAAPVKAAATAPPVKAASTRAASKKASPAAAEPTNSVATTAAPVKVAPVKKVAPVRKEMPVKNAAAPVKTAAPVKKAAPAKKAASPKKAAEVAAPVARRGRATG